MWWEMFAFMMIFWLQTDRRINGYNDPHMWSFGAVWLLEILVKVHLLWFSYNFVTFSHLWSWQKYSKPLILIHVCTQKNFFLKTTVFWLSNSEYYKLLLLFLTLVILYFNSSLYKHVVTCQISQYYCLSYLYLVECLKTIKVLL